jgi:hypothetical protein
MLIMSRSAASNSSSGVSVTNMTLGIKGFPLGVDNTLYSLFVFLYASVKILFLVHQQINRHYFTGKRRGISSGRHCFHTPIILHTHAEINTAAFYGLFAVELMKSSEPVDSSRKDAKDAENVK